MDKEHEVLLNAFVIAKKRYRVFYNAGILVWEDESSKKGNCGTVTVNCVDFVGVLLELWRAFFFLLEELVEGENRFMALTLNHATQQIGVEVKKT